MLKDYLTYILCLNFAISGAIHLYTAYLHFKAFYKYGDRRFYPAELIPQLKKQRTINYWALGIFVVSSFLLYFIAFGLQQ